MPAPDILFDKAARRPNASACAKTTAPILVPKMGAVIGNFFGDPAVRLRGPMGFASPGCPGFAIVGN